jgi:hypothetical protein
MILELIVSPDDEIQMELEPLIQTCSPMSEGDIQFVISMLVSRIYGVRMTFLGTDLPSPVPVSPYVMGRFIQKLSFNHVIPESLISRMNSHLTPRLKAQTCVKLRQCSFTYTQGRLDFLDRFICELGTSETTFPRFLECAVPLLTGTPHDSDVTAIRDLFIKHLSLCMKTLSQIKTSADMLRTNSVEYLMLQGVFIPPVSEVETAERLSMIKEILFRIYGWTEFNQDFPSDIDLGEHSGRESVSEIIKLLS